MLYVAAAVALIWLLWMPLYFKTKRNKPLYPSLIIKIIPTLTAAAFAGYACFATAQPNNYSKLIFAGLCVCALADWMLEVRFEVGGGLFFAGHVCYVLALLLFRPFSAWSIAVFIVAEVGLLFFLSKYRREIKPHMLVYGLALYTAALASLLAFSLPLPFTAFSRGTVLSAVGAVLFVLSDLTLCHNTVRKKPDSWHFKSLGAYYMAQLLLALSTFPNP